MERLDYNGLLEEWKVNLIVSRAARMGFRQSEIEDVQQEVVLDVLHFKYDPDRSNGARESTALIAVIDNRLKMLTRARTRHRERLDRLAVLAEHSAPSDEHGAIDVRHAVATLSPQEQEVCRLLGAGCSRQDISRVLGCGWHKVGRLVFNIREHFEALGFGNARCG